MAGSRLDMIHEDLQRHGAVRAGSDRAFGAVFGGVFLAVGLWPLLEGAAPRLWALGIAAAFGLAAWLVPARLAPFNRLWLRFGALLHRIVSPIALGIMFYVVITPFALAMRLFGRDELAVHPDASRTSYWTRREPPGPAGDSLKNQF